MNESMMIYLGVLYQQVDKIAIEDVTWLLGSYSTLREPRIEYWMANEENLRVLTDTLKESSINNSVVGGA